MEYEGTVHEPARLEACPFGFHLLPTDGLRMARHMYLCRQHGQMGMVFLRQRLSLACLQGYVSWAAQVPTMKDSPDP